MKKEKEKKKKEEEEKERKDNVKKIPTFLKLEKVKHRQVLQGPSGNSICGHL